MTSQLSLTTWKRRGRRFGFGLLVLCAVTANSHPGATSASARTSNFPVPDAVQTREITAVQAAARQHLDRFFQAVIGEDGVARQGAAVRVSLLSRNGKTDLIWVTPFAEQGGQFFGALSATPRNSPGLAEGDLIQFTRAEVVDWSFYGSDGRMYGNFTTRMMLNTISTARAAEIAALLTDTAAPEDW